MKDEPVKVTREAPAAPAATSNLDLPLANPGDDLHRIRGAMPALLDVFRQRLQSDPKTFPLLHFDQAHKVVRLSLESVGAAEDWFFIGDIHGDFFALHTLLRYAEQTAPGCKVLFLGDMVDRGDHHLECLFLLLEWGLHRPGRLGWIAGNHDVAFEWSSAKSRYTSSVSPAEFLDVLNQYDSMQGFRHALGHFFLEITQRLPRAFLFPDGLLATHGGFPLSDLQVQGATLESEEAYLEWLNSAACLKDFTWTRIHRAPKKLPDRYSTGAQYGFKDFEAFCALKPAWFPAQRMITGHEHPADGFSLHPTYKENQALTLVGFGFDDLKPMPAAYQHYKEALHIAQGVTGQLPEIKVVPVDHPELVWMYLQAQAVPQTSMPQPEGTEPSASKA